MSGTSEAIISAANPGMAVAPPSSTGATAVADRPTAAAGGSTAAATAVAAIAGLQGAGPPAEGGAGHRGRPVGQSHLVTGLANQKQVSKQATTLTY